MSAPVSTTGRNGRGQEKKIETADIPDLVLNEVEERDEPNEELVAEPANWERTSEADLRELKKALPHLSTEMILGIMRQTNFDVRAAKTLGEGLERVDLVPEAAKDIFAARIAMERGEQRKKTDAGGRFHGSKMLEKVCEGRHLADHYYKRKNRNANCWRRNQRKEPVLPKAEREELKKKMQARRIRFVNFELATEQTSEPASNDDLLF